MSPSPAFGPSALLIVEDDPDVMRALAFMADTRGYAVVGCGNATDALVATGAERFDCLIIDQNLPDMQGIDLLARLRKGGIDAPAILITTGPSDLLRRRSALANTPIVEKPLLDEMLFTQVDRLLRPA